MFSFFKPYIFSLDPETAHNLAIKSLKFNLIPKQFFEVENEDLLEIDLFGKKLKNPIGLAAGFDKSAEVYNSLYNFGFGFIEVGTVTPKMQLGNPKPRIFRLEKDHALINRLGFNNDGSDEVLKRISNNTPNGILGINIGPNKDTNDKIEDFKFCLSKFYNQSDYITINISSPNTEGLRNFHKQENLVELLDKLNSLRKKIKMKNSLFLKISPDLDDYNINYIIELLYKYNINGVILTNTTDKNRDSLTDKKKKEIGGLSGKPIKDLSTNLIKKFHKETKGKIDIIGVGGVDSGQSAFEKIIAGAKAVQLYTGMVYKGPNIASIISNELIDILKKQGIENISQAVGTKN